MSMAKTNTKTNEEILFDYRARAIQAVEGMLDDALNGPTGQEAASKDVTLFYEIFHMVEAYKADPSKPLLQAKLAFDRDDYRRDYTKAEMLDNMQKAMAFLGGLGPDARTA
jgi:hypothetical protein